jgi:Zn-dependent membrane protease YugP
VNAVLTLGPKSKSVPKQVLGAAAWTYVAAAVSAVGVWLFYVFILLFHDH